MAAILSESIRDGSFPDSNDLIGQETTSDGIALLLKSLAHSKSELTKEIGDVGQKIAGAVDEWILQAKKLQDDIARCKTEAENIVKEHDRGQVLRNNVEDAGSKMTLLDTEIAFTKALEHEIESIAETMRVLNEAEHDLSTGNLVLTVGKLSSVDTTIQSISAYRTRNLLSQLDRELRGTAQKRLEQVINSRWTVKRNETSIILDITLESLQNQSSNPDTSYLTTDSALSALQELQALRSAVDILRLTVQSFVQPAISTASPPYPSSVQMRDESLTITKDETHKNPRKILAILQTIFQFLNQKLPERLKDLVVEELVPKTISDLISLWLDPALPHNVQDLQQLEPLRSDVFNLSEALRLYAWPGQEPLLEWIAQIPRGWLARRRTASLDAVRKVFSTAQGTLRPVERIERQTIELDKPKPGTKEDDDDWSTNWDDEPQASDNTSKDGEDDEVSGWDFETDDNHDEPGKAPGPVKHNNDEEDEGDAWGWGDDDDDTVEESRGQSVSAPSKSQKPNGETAAEQQSRELVLTEIYHITDVPDSILEIVGKDVADAHELQDSPNAYFGTDSPVAGLLGVPNLALALFRATAPTYYTLPSAKYSLTNLNLYNDTSYLVQRLQESLDASVLSPSIQSLTKFARQVYSAELDVQRTILADLLDGAQGFDRCTTFPNSQACADAVSSTVDRLRQLHRDWSGILGESHLLQSLGSLLTMVFGKVIKDIEDMDDISEAESKQLVTFCQQILSLEDVFASRLPDLTSARPDAAAEADQSPPSQIVLYVPNYLRFQYLQQILESSLVDIKYLWTEGEMSLEFSVDEVVDLIKALFAESQYRRDAIKAIRG